MGADDKAENTGQNLAGKAKEAMGKATDDKDLEKEGRSDQRQSHLKQAAENVKDAFKS